MKLSYLLVAVLGLSAIFAPSVFARGVKPVKGIDVVVQNNPGGNNGRQTAAPDKNGNLIVQLPGPGNFTISYANGPKKGQVIKIVKTTKAESISCKVDKAYLSAPASKQ